MSSESIEASESSLSSDRAGEAERGRISGGAESRSKKRELGVRRRWGRVLREAATTGVDLPVELDDAGESERLERGEGPRTDGGPSPGYPLVESKLSEYNTRKLGVPILNLPPHVR